MSETKSVSVQVGPGLPGLLGIVFIVLKLTHVIDWSWVWVLAPFWLGLAIVAGFLVLGALGLVFFRLVAYLLDKKASRDRQKRRAAARARALRDYGTSLGGK